MQGVELILKKIMIIYGILIMVLLIGVALILDFNIHRSITIKNDDVDQVYIHITNDENINLIKLNKEQNISFLNELSKIKLKKHFGDVKGKSHIVLEVLLKDGSKYYFDAYRVTKVDISGNEKIVNMMCLETEWIEFIENFLNSD